MIGGIARQLIGLFVDDELLATTILCVVGVISVLALLARRESRRG